MEISLYISNFSKEVSQLTDPQENQKYFDLVYKDPRNVPPTIRKISQSELDISLYLSNFTKEVSQLTD